MADRAVQAEWDAVVVGAGPNGLAAACELARRGSRVLLVEAGPTVGGGCRSAALMFDDHQHDVCAAVHAFGPVSPFFSSLPLARYGLQWVRPDIAMSHPFDDGSAAYLHANLEKTVTALGSDGPAYRKMISAVEGSAFDVALGPVWRGVRSPVRSLRLASVGLKSADRLARGFTTRGARGLFAGLAAHAIAPLDQPLTGGVGALLGAAAHEGGWPFVAGGSQKLADALAAYFEDLGGTIRYESPVRSLADIPAAKIVMFDLVPAVVERIIGTDRLGFGQRPASPGPGAFKVDWVMHSPIPWRDLKSRTAGTVHLGGTYEAIADSERLTADGSMPEQPFVLIAQPTQFDDLRAPKGRHIAWGYCHVPRGFTGDATVAIEAQVDRFAPGFSDTIIGRHTMGPSELEGYNANYVGGDITGGPIGFRTLLSSVGGRSGPYRIPGTDWFMCSAATPPGAGIHGMCGYHAARSALRHLASM